MRINDTAIKPAALAVDPAGIPAELVARPQWVGWDYRPKRNKPDEWTKVPFNPHTGGEASSTNSTTWGTLERALARQERDSLAGVGYVFREDDPYAGVDLDKCRDPLTERVEPWAAEIIAELDSYTELSPSESGVHVIVRATKPGDRTRRGKVEMYDRGRYFTFTGHRMPGTPAAITHRQDKLDVLYQRVFGQQEASSSTANGAGATSDLADDDILYKLRTAGNAAKFVRLWAGDLADYDSASEADLALCSLIAFYTSDAGQIDRLFRRSGLMRPKWDERHYGGGRTYGQGTIAKALSRSERWTPPGTTPNRGRRAANATSPSGGGAEPASPAESFPDHVLPPAVRAFVVSAAASIGCPVDYVAVPLLGLAEGCIGKSRRLIVRPGFEVSPGSWYAVVGESGTGKSPALKRAMSVIKPLQDEAWQLYRDKLDHWGTLTKEERGDKPTPEHFYVTDSTGEALWAALASSPGVAQVEDELRRWLKALDAYRQAGDRQTKLGMWSNAPVKIVRRSSDPVYIPFPVAPLIGGIQPGVLGRLRGEGDDADADDGWVPRFLLTWPDAEPLELSEVPFDETTQPPVEQVFRRLRLYNDEPHDTRLSTAAYARFREWHSDNRHVQLAARGFERQWAAKAPTHLARLTLVLHLFSAPSGTAPVSVETLEAAIELTEYFRDHLARALPAFGTKATARLQTRITRIFRTVGQDARGWVDRTTILDKLRNVTPDALTAALAAMEASGLVESRRVPTRTKPREEWRMVPTQSSKSDVGDSGFSGDSPDDREYPNNPNGRTSDRERDEPTPLFRDDDREEWVL